jgi:hypothetical protein
MAVVPAGQLVPTFWSTMAWEPWVVALVVEQV